MELYIGGISQGKLQYVCNKKHISRDSIEICDGAVCSMKEILSKRIINQFHLFIKRLWMEEIVGEANLKTPSTPQDMASAFIEVLIAENPSAVIICNEVGYGIVPMDKTDRIYRETVGRCLCRVAEYSTSVERIVCGLGMKLK